MMQPLNQFEEDETKEEEEEEAWNETRKKKMYNVDSVVCNVWKWMQENLISTIE